MGGLIAFLAFVTLVYLFSLFGRSDDPMLDPMNNPNIRVGIDV
jgi:hypothetical protein